MFATKRVYTGFGPDDGLRVLVDRLWSRGLSKADAAVDHWLKDIAPSPELRTWFGHQPSLWPEFQSRYGEELQSPERMAALERLLDLGRGDAMVTLLFGAREERYNHAVMLCELLDNRLRLPGRTVSRSP